MDFTVALAQVKPKLGCVADNLGMIEAAVERGIGDGAGLVDGERGRGVWLPA